MDSPQLTDIKVLEKGPKGLPTVAVKGRYLHSPYNPQEEIKRYLAKTLPDTVKNEPTLFVVFGETLGLIAEGLKAYPGSKSVGIFPNEFLRLKFLHSCDWSWSPGSPEPFANFIHSFLKMELLDAVQIVPWPTALEAWPELFSQLQTQFLEIFRQVQGTRLNVEYFGPRLLKNTLSHASKPLTLKMKAGDQPIILAASGPSLQLHREFLVKNQERLNIWALPSSLRALQSWGVEIEAVVSTDPGFYAKLHLHQLNQTQTILVQPLNAAVTRLNNPVFWFHQGSTLEKKLGHPELMGFLSQGTVAVTALKLALKATRGPVYVLGMDMCFTDLREHVFPHTWDIYFQNTYSRMCPHETFLMDRIQKSSLQNLSSGYRTSNALLTYAQWLGQEKDYFEGRVKRISPSPLHWGSMEEMTDQSFYQSISSRRESHFAPMGFPLAQDHLTSLEKTLKTDLEKGSIEPLTEDLFKHLSPRVWMKWKKADFFGNPNFSKGELKAEIQKILDFLKL